MSECSQSASASLQDRLDRLPKLVYDCAGWNGGVLLLLDPDL